MLNLPPPWLRIELRLGHLPRRRDRRKVRLLQLFTPSGVADIVLDRMIVDSPPQIKVSQPSGSCGSEEPSGEATPATPPIPIYHDPHPPFETDGRGRVVWSNSSEQIRLQSRSSLPAKSSNDETTTMREKESGGAAGPEVETGDGGKCNADGKSDGDGQEMSVESAGQVRVAP
jgi:hypothetical protein